MKSLVLILFVFSIVFSGYSQSVGIGTTDPNDKAALEIVQGAQPQGFLIPRINAADRIAWWLTSTDVGMMVYDTDSLDIMQWNGTEWTRLGGADEDWQIVGIKMMTDKLVGINANPTELIEVGGDVVFGGGNYDGSQEFIMMNGKSKNWFLGVNNNTEVNKSDFYVSNTLDSDGTFHIKPNGNIGIGTTVPDVNLDIDGGIALKDTLVGTTSATLVIGNKSYYKVESVPGDFMDLTNGLTVGQIIIIQSTGFGIGIVDEPNVDVEGSGVILEYNDTVTLIWDGAKWIQTAYSDNSP